MKYLGDFLWIHAPRASGGQVPREWQLVL